MIVMTETARRLLVRSGPAPITRSGSCRTARPSSSGAGGAEQAGGRRPHYVTPMPGGYERMQSRFLLSTFGLLSPGKGSRRRSRRCRRSIERHPEVLYLIAGRTHPQVARREGEQYRLMLERRVVDLGLGDHVEFDDRFLSIDELADLLAATDVFVTPYRNREQIASGALTFALAAGCAAISTPYWYAEDMLASGAGRLVPFEDPQALADAVCEFIEEPGALEAAREEARRIGDRARLALCCRGYRLGAARGRGARASPDSDPRRRARARGRADETTCSRSSTTPASCSTRTASSPTARPATAWTTSRVSSSSRSSSDAATRSSRGTRSCTGRSPISTPRPTRAAAACAIS